MGGRMFDLTGSYLAASPNGLAWNLLNLGIAATLLRATTASLRRPRFVA